MNESKCKNLVMSKWSWNLSSYSGSRSCLVGIQSVRTIPCVKSSLIYTTNVQEPGQDSPRPDIDRMTSNTRHSLTGFREWSNGNDWARLSCLQIDEKWQGDWTKDSCETCECRKEGRDRAQVICTNTTCAACPQVSGSHSVENQEKLLYLKNYTLFGGF